MNDKQCMQVLNEIFMEVFQHKCMLTIDQVLSELAFDIRLPNRVIDSVDGKETWASSINSNKYISQKNMTKYDEYKGWMRKKVTLNGIDDIINMWNIINYTTTERNYDSVNVSKSDTIYGCENVYRCQDCRQCKNIIFSDGASDLLYSLACERSSGCNYCIRVSDSSNCANSYNVICSNKISNSFFIQDANSLHECMFCSHISNRRFCIANMQCNRDEYMKIKEQVVRWMLTELNSYKTQSS